MMGGPQSELIFSQNPSSQLHVLEFLQPQPIILEFLQIPKSQLILGKQSQFPANESFTDLDN